MVAKDTRRGGEKTPRQRERDGAAATATFTPAVSDSRPALCGEPVEMLKKGGGGGKGELLAEGNTLADCGLTTSMSIYEHLWVDSAANQTAFWAEYEKMASYVKTQVTF